MKKIKGKRENQKLSFDKVRSRCSSQARRPPVSAGTRSFVKRSAWLGRERRSPFTHVSMSSSTSTSCFFSAGYYSIVSRLNNFSRNAFVRSLVCLDPHSPRRPGEETDSDTESDANGLKAWRWKRWTNPCKRASLTVLRLSPWLDGEFKCKLEMLYYAFLKLIHPWMISTIIRYTL
jgi:hypothetical protein